MASSLNIEDLYSAAEGGRINALEQARQDSMNRLQSNLSDIRSSYRSSVTQAQAASRISALGTEEKLAAAGLSSGSAHAQATSGYTETSRIASDNKLRSNLNQLALSRMKQEQAARQTSSTELSQAYQDYQNGLSDIQLQRAQATINQYNADRNAAQADREYAYKVNRTAYEQAMQRWQTYGVVLPADASVLGVPAGTRTASSEYNNARLALERWKALL